MPRGKTKGAKQYKPKKVCTICHREISIDNFYNSKSPVFEDGKVTICKRCIQEMVDYKDMNTVYKILQILDIPFFYNRWEENAVQGGNMIGRYIRMANSGINEFNNAKWEDSVFDKNGSNNEKDYEKMKIKERTITLTDEQRKTYMEKWGIGYSDKELYSFEKKYDMLKESYSQKTAMHTEALLTYIRYRVKEELATAEGNVAEARQWGGLADRASEKAKLNPNQLKQADLTGGLNCFGELSRAVEQAVDIIPILPKFIKKPQDEVDFTLWCYINYIRRLKGLPDCTYEEIYNFYEERKKEYKYQDDREFLFDDEENDGDVDDAK